VGADEEGIEVVDVRDEANAVFAADAVSRTTGVPGVAAVTAGPGVTNTTTAVKNAQMAQSPVVILGGAAATLLQGRGALQDIDQLSLMESLTKWSTRVTKRSALGPTITKALEVATAGVPGPVFVEIPVDLLYEEEIVRDWYMEQSGVEKMSGPKGKAFELYLKGHLAKLFRAPHLGLDSLQESFSFGRATSKRVDRDGIQRAADALADARQPTLVVGSQTLVNVEPDDAPRIADAIERLGLPTYLGGRARGLLGTDSDIEYKHKRTAALKESDVAIVSGFPFDFRLGYGQKINADATLVAANLSDEDLTKNRQPEIGLQMHPGRFLVELAETFGPSRRGVWSSWFETLDEREETREASIAEQAEEENENSELVSPLYFFQRMDEAMDDDALIVVDGGDFVATGAYILQPRGPMRWLDPGVFGTLGVGGGFALGAGLTRPDSEIWLVWGDGSSGYSLAEFDTYVRHGLAPIAVVGTDASWAQIEREQVEILGTDLGCELRKSEYHKVAEGYGGEGILVDDPDDVDDALREAKEIAGSGTPVLVNVHLADSDFRKGSISM
jgi:acetolactate synthase-1/2/3 large subunit